MTRVSALADSASELIDPLGGLEDLARRRLREAGPRAFAEDPLRVLRLVRLAVELDLEADPDTRARAQTHAAALGKVAPERIFMELRRIIDAPGAVAGLELMGEVGATAVVLPELEALRGVTQSRYHHLDVYGHTLEVLEQVIALQEDPVAVLGSTEGSYREGLTALLAEPLADGLTRGGALRWGALLHDAAKPLTRGVRPSDGRVTFIGHDARGAQLAGEVLDQVASERSVAGPCGGARAQPPAAGLPRARAPAAGPPQRVRLSAQPASRWRWTSRCSLSPTASPPAASAHRRRSTLICASRGGCSPMRSAGVPEGPPQPLLRGDELASELGIPAGPRLGELLEELLRAQYAGEIATREDALAYARAHAG